MQLQLKKFLVSEFEKGLRKVEAGIGYLRLGWLLEVRYGWVSLFDVV
jgi:hypothetical protein